jgi:hypothetical protein
LKYRDGLRRSAVQTFVDIEGDIVWTTEYLRYRVNSCDHDRAVQLVLAQIGGGPPSPGCAQTITGRERLEWDQAAADARELASFGFAMYVDGTRTVLAGVNCAATPAGENFVCSARLPALSFGTHTRPGGVRRQRRVGAGKCAVVAAPRLRHSPDARRARGGMAGRIRDHDRR